MIPIVLIVIFALIIFVLIDLIPLVMSIYSYRTFASLPNTFPHKEGILNYIVISHILFIILAISSLIFFPKIVRNIEDPIPEGFYSLYDNERLIYEGYDNGYHKIFVDSRGSAMKFDFYIQSDNSSVNNIESGRICYVYYSGDQTWDYESLRTQEGYSGDCGVFQADTIMIKEKTYVKNWPLYISLTLHAINSMVLLILVCICKKRYTENKTI
ncbi:MAG: hypothetical protein K6F49_03365 [Saccharofermentans sp.]|nr:hypothetical protein [Saccharofermentans sp.]